MSAVSESTQEHEPRLLRSSFAGSVVLWMAHPPVGFGLLAWFAPILWLRWCIVPELPGKRPYLKLWLIGLVFWMFTVQWVRLPHPMNYIGWPTLAGYLGIYVPLFVALTRVGVHRYRLPLWMAAPVVWTGLEWVRGQFLTGFLMGALAHTQVGFQRIIQFADLVGEYGVTFLIVLVAACFTSAFFPAGRFQLPPFKAGVVQLLPAALLFAAAGGYGEYKVAVEAIAYHRSPPGPRLALIQGNILADWSQGPERRTKIMEEYLNLSFEATKQSQDRDRRHVDVVIWPECTFRVSYLSVDEKAELPSYADPKRVNASTDYLQTFVRQLQSAVLVGIDHVHFPPSTEGESQPTYYNSALFMNRGGDIVGVYDKMHRVVLGEYVPYVDWLPFLKYLTPITGLVQAGSAAVAMEHQGVIYAPNICYESLVPHLIRRHVVELTDQGQAPDVLVNLTNDAWFWGSSELDMHLACGVFRCIEMRKPMVIAANGGLSGDIDPYGKVRQKTERQQQATLLVDLKTLPSRGKYPSFYAAYGDWFAILCVVCCLVLTLLPCLDRDRKGPSPGISPEPLG